MCVHECVCVCVRVSVSDFWICGVGWECVQSGSYWLWECVCVYMCVCVCKFSEVSEARPNALGFPDPAAKLRLQ